MSAAEIIEQIKALPREEQRQVFNFVAETQRGSERPAIRFASDEEARAASEYVIGQYPEVFKRLAE